MIGISATPYYFQKLDCNRAKKHSPFLSLKFIALSTKLVQLGSPEEFEKKYTIMNPGIKKTLKNSLKKYNRNLLHLKMEIYITILFQIMVKTYLNNETQHKNTLKTMFTTSKQKAEIKMNYSDKICRKKVFKKSSLLPLTRRSTENYKKKVQKYLQKEIHKRKKHQIRKKKKSRAMFCYQQKFPFFRSENFLARCRVARNADCYRSQKWLKIWKKWKSSSLEYYEGRGGRSGWRSREPLIVVCV